MANHYLLFSELIPALTDEERAWAEQVLACTCDSEPDVANNLNAAGIDIGDSGDVVDLDDWPGFQWEILPRDADLSMYADESGNILHVGAFVQALLFRFRPSDCWQPTWAETCLRPRIGEFGGGGLFVTAQSVQLLRAADWVHQHRRAFEAG